MNKIITLTEKRIANKLIEETRTLQLTGWSEWGAMAVMAMGGLVIVAVISLALANPYTETVRLVFFSGIFTGMLLLMGGAYGLHVCELAQEKKALASLLQKLMP